MSLTNLTSILDRVGNDPFLNNRVTVSGARNGGNISNVPMAQQFPSMSVGTSFDGQTSAHWVRNRDNQTRKYKGSTHMAIGAIAKMVAMQDVVVQRRFIPKNSKTGTKYEKVPFTHPLVELFEEVNPVDTLWDLWFYMVGWRLTTGCSMVFKARNGFGLPKQLWPTPSQWTRAIPDQQVGIKGYEVDGGVGTYFVDADSMIHVKDPSLDWSGHGRYYGHAAIDAAETTITLEEQMLDRLFHTFKNFAPPGMVFSTDQRLQPHQVHQLWANLSAQHSMSEHSGRPMIVHSGLKLEGQFGGSGTRELDYTGSLDKTLEITLATFGVPKAVLGMVEGSNKASAQAGLVQFCKMTIDPILKQFSQHFTQDLASDFTDDKSLVVRIGPCAVDKEEQLASMIEVMIKAGAITPDEVRETLLNMDPLDSPHGSKAVMVSGFQAIDPVTGLPDQLAAPAKPEKQASPESDTKTVDRPKSVQGEDTVTVGRQALAGAQS